MSIKYEIQTIHNSQGCGNDRHYARIFEREQLTDRQLETLIQTNCSLTVGDIHAALIALREQMLHQLSTGRRGSPDNVRGKHYPNISTKHDRFPEKMFTFAV